jgi:signal transduction histidine kinase
MALMSMPEPGTRPDLDTRPAGDTRLRWQGRLERETRRYRQTRLDRGARLDLWERLEQPALAILPYVMLVVSVIATGFIEHSSGRSLLIDVALSALAAVWMLWLFTLHPAWRERPRVMAVFFIVLLVIAAVLVIRAPWYGFFAYTLYFFAFWLPAGKWRLVAVLSVAWVAATSQDGGLPKPDASAVAGYVVLIAVNMFLVSGLTWFALVGAEQNERRKVAVAELSEANRKLEATLAENAGLHEQLLAQAREAGIFDERQRMAGEIHDTLAQGLIGIIAQMQAAELAGHDGDWGRHVTAATQLARESLSEARRSVHALRPAQLETARLGEALGNVAEQWSTLNGVTARVTTTGSARPVPPEVELTLLRTAQEALANVAKHARASRVGLTLSYMEDQVTLDIRDDGVGFQLAPDPVPVPVPDTVQRVPGGSGSRPSNGSRSPRPDASSHSSNGTGSPQPAAPSPQPEDGPPAGGFGLTAMRQRIEGMAGTLEIESEPGSGTAVSASVPITAGSGR